MKDAFYENKLSVLPPSSGLHREKTSKLQLCLEPCQRSLMQLFCENDSRYSTVNYFHKQSLS